MLNPFFYFNFLSSFQTNEQNKKCGLWYLYRYGFLAIVRRCTLGSIFYAGNGNGYGLGVDG